MASSQKIIGALVCVFLSSTLLVNSQGMSGIMGRLRGGGKKHGGGDGLAHLLAAGVIAKLFSFDKQHCHHQHEGRNNLFALTLQRNALLQQRKAFFGQENFLFHPRYTTFQPQLPQVHPRFGDLQPKSAYLQARLAYLQQRQASPYYPLGARYQPAAESHRVPYIHGLLNGFF